MKKIIIYRHNMEQCDFRRKELGLSPQDCILISYSMGDNLIQRHIKGYYREVMNDEIQLDGLSKKDFNYYYNL